MCEVVAAAQHLPTRAQACDIAGVLTAPGVRACGAHRGIGVCWCTNAELHHAVTRSACEMTVRLHEEGLCLGLAVLRGKTLMMLLLLLHAMRLGSFFNMQISQPGLG